MTGPDRVIRTTATLPDRQVARLADELSTLKRDVETLARAQRAAQLGDSSIENGALVIFDEFGLERLRLGSQTDGTFVSASLNNPNPPPVPNMPVVEPGTGVIKVTSAGFTGGVPVPLDFAYFTVYTAPQGQTDRKDGTITTDPGSWIIDTGTQFLPHTVWLTATNLSGRESQPSEVNTATPTKVVSDAILAGAVTELQLAADAVTAAKVKAGNIGTAAFAGGSVTLAALANGSVDATKLVTGAVTTEKIAANAVAAGQLAAGAVVAGSLAANSVTANELAANSVTTVKLAADSVAAGKIAVDAVTTRELLALSVTSDILAANAVTAGKITAGSVTAAKLESTLIVTTRLLAGSPTGTRAEVNSSGFEAWTGSTQTFDVDAATGNVMMLGLYKTAQAGTRVELGGSSGADVIRFFPGTGSAFAKAESFSDGSNAGISLQASGATTSTRVGTVFLRRTYASLGLATSDYDATSEFYAEPNFVRARSAVVDLIVDKSLTAQDGSRRVSFIHYSSGGTGESRAYVTYSESSSDSTPRACFHGVNVNCGLKFQNNQLEVISNLYAYGPVGASAFNVNSAQDVKENVGEIVVPDDRSSWDIVEGAPSLQWDYTYEGSRTATPVDAEGNPARVTNLDGTQTALEWDGPLKPRRRHKFPVLEDLAELDGNLVDTDGSMVDLRDMVGVLWDAVDMLIKRTRVLEFALAQRNITVPPRPQRGDVVAGVGAIKPGRTHRDIDPETGQQRNRKKENT